MAKSSLLVKGKHISQLRLKIDLRVGQARQRKQVQSAEYMNHKRSTTTWAPKSNILPEEGGFLSGGGGGHLPKHKHSYKSRSGGMSLNRHIAVSGDADTTTSDLNLPSALVFVKYKYYNFKNLVKNTILKTYKPI